MQILFIDESGTPPPIDKVEHSPYFVLGGVVIPENLWHQVKDDIDIIKHRFEIKGEIKWRYFSPLPARATAHPMSHLTAAEKEQLRTQLYRVISKYKSVRIISVVTHNAAAYSLPYIQTPDDLFWYSYKQMTERFQYYLQDISRVSGEKINGIIICDHRAPKDDKRLQELHGRLLRGTKDAHSSYQNLIEGVFIAPSHLSVGIQLADITAGAVLRKFKNDDERYFAQISGSFRQSSGGTIEGYGLVCYPKK